MDYNNIGKYALQVAEKLGANYAEAYVANSAELGIDVVDQKVEAVENSDTHGIGIRVFVDNKIGFCYTTELDRHSAIEAAVGEAIANAENSFRDTANSLPEPANAYPNLELVDEDLAKITIEEKIDFAKELERTARNFDSRIKIVENCSYRDASYQISIVNSKGIDIAYRGSYAGGSAYIVAEANDESQAGFAYNYQLKYKALNPAEIGLEAAHKAVRMLGAKEIKTQRITTVLDPYVATRFLGLISPSLSAQSVQKGKSLFTNKIKQKISSDQITIIDDGALVNGINSAPFDGEGVASQKNILIENGILHKFLHNTYTALKDNTVSTGNGTRGSFKGLPEVGTTNFYINPGKVAQQDLLKEIKKGFYITEVLGMHTANPISGDFSVGAAGLLIENGEFTVPVKGVAIAGNILDLLQSVDLVANDLRFFIGFGSPTIRISQMSISGT